jgi:uncharacterized protein
VTPDSIIAQLQMSTHDEGGHFAEAWRGEPGEDGRASGSSIYYLLRAGERSQWHRVDATELWLFHAGGPLALDYVAADGVVRRYTLGPALNSGELLQVVIPAGCWQTAVPLGSWTLVACVMVPGFTTEGWELAPPNWSPQWTTSDGA